MQSNGREPVIRASRRIFDRIAIDFCRRHAFLDEVVTTAIKRHDEGPRRHAVDRVVTHIDMHAIRYSRLEAKTIGAAGVETPSRRQKGHDVVGESRAASSRSI